MSQEKREILQLFKEDYNEAKEEPEGINLLSEKDDVRIIYYGHYPEYREEFDEIIKDLNSFFDFS